MRILSAIFAARRVVARAALALRYYSKLRYSWHLSWVKAGSAR